MVTIKDIAKECNVSIATVSNVVNGKNKVGAQTQKRILEAIEKYGYKPNLVAKGLRSKRSGVIGIIVEDMAQFTTPDIVEGIMHRIEDYGYKSVLVNLRFYSRWSDTWFNDESMLESTIKQSLSEISSMQADGLIYVAVHGRNVTKIPEDIGIPAVMTYAYEQNPQVPSVVIDDELSAYTAMKYLLEKGHREIAIIGGRTDNLHTQLRLKGAVRALDEYGVTVPDDRLFYVKWNRDDGYKAAEELFGRDKKVTAVFCMTDRMAGGVYQYLYDNGRVVGGDCSVIGYDGQSISDYFIPGLTTMALPLDRIGDCAARLLMEKLEGIQSGIELKDNILAIPCEFVERESVRDLNADKG
ncbi:MAG: LacI family transcriptional regulator [Lachnospiraceae bacterium]|nr:LacI family transcriptional regulator [Lachnospiraceae bacterium]